jgi:hypothetical protein
MKLFITFIVIALSLCGCQSKKENLTAQKIVDLAIEVSGKEKFKNSNISFSFREHKYISEGNCGNFIYSRIKTDSAKQIKDVYHTQRQLKRYLNDSLIALADSTANNYAESINSVMYFVQLPYRLNDNAVNKTYEGIDSIKGKAYHKIAVNFDEKGGGTDYQDNYLYWFNTEDYKLDYLAYSFVVNGGGIRFREAINERIVEGVRFVDYKNYKPKNNSLKLKDILKAFEKGQLELLSKIKNFNIEIKKKKGEC